MSKKMIDVTARSGHKFQVDASDEACRQFKIPNKNGKEVAAKYGMKVEHTYDQEEGIIQGVAPHLVVYGFPALWVKWKNEKVGFSKKPILNLRV
ncbi:MAG: hypothetical protein PF488_00465 [Patescibacteria group bacterium]|jgi:hypothetical protein|nr:hypothetical protein [Patescibacteria group bacterium]